MSKQQPSDSQVIHLPSRMNRHALCTDVSHSDQTVRIINIHLESLDHAASKKLRTQQVTQLGPLLLPNSVLLGDCNFHHSEQFYHHSIHGLIDSAGNQRDALTYHIELNPLAQLTAYDDELSRRLDRIYVSQTFSVNNYQVQQVFYSDHFPVIARIQLND